MIRLIKRYGSRKLYDTEESRYVSLEEIGDWVRRGQQVQVIDNQSTDDVTAQTLTQVILEEGKRGTSPVSSDFLYDLIRRGEQVVSLSVQSVQDGVDRLLQASVDRVPPLRQVRDETEELRRRLETLEAAIADIEIHRHRGMPPNGGASEVDTLDPDRAARVRARPAKIKGE